MNEAQEKLQEQKQQLLEKEKQVEAAKDEAEQKTKSVRGLSRYEAQLHDSVDGTFSEHQRFLPPNPHCVPTPPSQRAGQAPAGGDERGRGPGAETYGQTQPAAGLQDPGAAHRSAVGGPQRDQRGPGRTCRSRLCT